MHKFIQNVSRDYSGNITGCEYDADLFSPVIGMLNKNNTFFPAVERVIFNGPFTKVFFKDGTSSSVKCSDKDSYSKDAAVAFAIFKRMFGTIKENGEITGEGFSTYLHKIVTKMAFDQGAYEAKAKAEHAAKKAKKIEAEKKAKKEQPPKNSAKKTVKVKKASLPLRDSRGHFMKK